MHFQHVQSAACTAFLIMICVFTNVKGTAEIEKFQLKITNDTIKHSPLVINVLPKMDRLTLYPNDTVQFNCSATGSTGTYAAISHNGLEKKRNVSNSRDTLVNVDFSLPRAECFHAGSYMCKTGNMKYFTNLSIDIVVQCVTQNEKFSPEKKDKYFASSRGLQGPTLTCEETSLGSSIVLSIRREDGEVLSQIEDSNLVNYTFGRMQCTDIGKYSCVAESKTQARTTTQMLDISVNNCPPKLCKHNKMVEIDEGFALPFAFQICIRKPQSPNVTGIYVKDTWIFLGQCHSGLCFSYLHLVSRFDELINLTINDTSLLDEGKREVLIGTGYNYKVNYVNYIIAVVGKGTPQPNFTANVGKSLYRSNVSPIMTPLLIGISSVAGLFVIIAAIIIYLYRGKIKHFQLKLSKRCYNTGDGLFLGARPAENAANNEATTSSPKTPQQVDTSAERADASAQRADASTRETSTTDSVQETRASVVSNGRTTMSLPLTSRLPDVAFNHQNEYVTYNTMSPDNASVSQSLNSPSGNPPYGSPFYGNPQYSGPVYGNPPYSNAPHGIRPPDVVFEYSDGRIGHMPVITETMFQPENGTVTYITRSPEVSVRYCHDTLPATERRDEEVQVCGTLTNMQYIPDVMLTNMTYNPDGTLSSLKYNTDGTLSSMAYNPDGTLTALKYNPESGQVHLPLINDEKLSALPYDADGPMVNGSYGLDGASQPKVHHTQDVYQVTTTTNNNNQFTDRDGVVYVTSGNTQVIKKTERVIHEEIRETVEFVNMDYVNAAAKPEVTCEETQNEANRTYEEQQTLYNNR